MNSKKTFWFLALGLVVLLLGATVLYHHLADSVERDALATQTPPQPEVSGEEATVDTTGQTDDTPAEPVLAPDFTVLDWEGNEVTLSDCMGKPVVINFWASWCGPCKSEMADFNDAYSEYGDRVHFMMVNLTDGSRETADTAKAYVTEHSFTFPVFFDTTYSAAIAYGASAIPMTFFIDAEGCAVAYGQGAMSRDTLQMGLDMILPPE